MYILITRQLEKSKKFSLLLNKNNIKNFIYPVILIKNIKPKKIDLENLKKSDLVIFTSPNSISSIADLLKPSVIKDKIIVSIGESTKEILESIKIKVNIVPKINFSSESLLCEIKKNKISNKKIIIIKGTGGRNLLKSELSKNNYVFEDMNVYERNIPSNIDIIPTEVFKNISHICITSVDILNNLITIFNKFKLKISNNLIFIAGNKRIAVEIEKKFINNKVIVSLNPNDKEMLKTILS